MSQVHVLHDVSVVLVQVVFWVCLQFCVTVSLFWPWWKTDLGWTIVLKTACIAALLLPANLSIVFGINVMTPAWQWTGAVLLGLVALIVLWRQVVIWVLQSYDPPPTKDARSAAGRARLRWKQRKRRDGPVSPDE